MAHVISFANQKGGVGKSTLSLLTATALQTNYNKDCKIIECDKQGTLTGWRNFEINQYEEDPPYDIEYREISELKDTLEKDDSDYDYIFVDMPGTLYSTSEGESGLKGIIKLLILCDSVIIPMMGGAFDLSSSVAFIKKIKQVQEVREDHGYPFQFFALVNGKRRKNEYKKLNNFIDQNNIPHFETELKDYVFYQRNQSSYESLLDASPKGESEEHAKKDFKSYIEEFLSKTNSHG